MKQYCDVNRGQFVLFKAIGLKLRHVKTKSNSCALYFQILNIFLSSLATLSLHFFLFSWISWMTCIPLRLCSYSHDNLSRSSHILLIMGEILLYWICSPSVLDHRFSITFQRRKIDVNRFRCCPGIMPRNRQTDIGVAPLTRSPDSKWFKCKGESLSPDFVRFKI